ncbi:uncharacterized protein METZ01_LOCUS121019, partial [marine metagenome]
MTKQPIVEPAANSNDRIIAHPN